MPSFYHWHFPHGHLPPAWETLPVVYEPTSRSASTGLYLSDKTCRLTDCGEECDGAYLCPKTEQPWFHREKMLVYNVDRQKCGVNAVSDLGNLVLLRPDIHRILDKAKFVFVPKGGKLVVNLLYTTKELYTLYHNRELLVCKSAKEFIFARFAWAILKGVGNFGASGGNRLLKLADGDAYIGPDVYQSPGFMSGPEKQDRGGASLGSSRGSGQGPDQMNESFDTQLLQEDAPVVTITSPKRSKYRCDSTFDITQQQHHLTPPQNRLRIPFSTRLPPSKSAARTRSHAIPHRHNTTPATRGRIPPTTHENNRAT